MNKRFIIGSSVVILIVVGLVLNFNIVDKGKLKEDYYLKSLEARMKFDYETSLGFLQKAFELDPDDYMIMAALAIDYSVIGEEPKAIELLEKALPQFNEVERRKHIYYWSNLADLYYSAGKVDLALDTYKQTLQIDSNYYEANLNLGTTLLQLNRIQEAAKYLEKAHDLVPNDRAILVNLGSLYYRLGYYDQAERSYLRVLELKDVQMQDYINLALFYEKRNAPDQAEKYYLRAIEESPNNTSIINKIALYYFRVNNYSKAKEYFQKIVAQHPTDTKVNIYLGIITFREKNYLKSIEYLLKVDKKESNNLALVYLGYSYYNIQEYEDALLSLNEFITLRKKAGDQKQYLHEMELIDKISRKIETEVSEQ